jgi:hypothetical protein
MEDFGIYLVNTGISGMAYAAVQLMDAATAKAKSTSKEGR